MTSSSTATTKSHASAPNDEAADPAKIALERYQAAFPDANPAALDAHLQIVRAGNDMRLAIARSLGGERNTLTGPRYSLLRILYLAEDQRLPQNELARQLGSTPANITQLLDGLERDGMIERLTHSADRRVSYAQLTTQGRATCDVLVPRMVDVMQGTVAGLTRKEMADLARLLSKLRRHLRTYQPATD